MILTTNVQNSQKGRNYLDLLAIEETRKERKASRNGGSSRNLVRWFARKMHF
ncbi:MAG: hypothetical protein KIY12_00810 [Thermoplasmata archaeon]|uniref:Uncharacterized protein n=1 Tax=Candidatus Sysuiplasma superficiale TaxID=2823368 RepID=A0A8J7YSG9_9ARCH|nr:hypothetical protein [Candidatus Sysuiplasma superficiale]